ncbi:MAG: hypothetical protein ACRCUP_00155 [Mycoplasmatales bacterium]
MVNPKTKELIDNLKEHEQQFLCELYNAKQIEELYEINSIKIMFKLWQMKNKFLYRTELMYRDSENFEKDYENGRLEQWQVDIIDKGYKYFWDDENVKNDEGTEYIGFGLNYIYTVPQANEYGLIAKARRVDLDQYFSQEITKYKTGVYVFQGKTENDLILLQRYYAMNWGNYEHMLWRGLGDDGEQSILRQADLRMDAEFWGRKEWVQNQVDKVEDEEMRNKLYDCTYETILCIFFSQWGKAAIIANTDRGVTTQFKNIKLDRK